MQLITVMSMGASKPATYGRFKTSQGSDALFPCSSRFGNVVVVSLPRPCGAVRSSSFGGILDTLHSIHGRAGFHNQLTLRTVSNS